MTPEMSVRHRVFGSGTIIKIDEDLDRIHIRFASREKLSIATCLEMGLLEPV